MLPCPGPLAVLCTVHGGGGGWVPWIPPGGWCGPDLVLHSQEKRRKQAEIESKRRQLEDGRRQLQHLKVGLGEGPPGCWHVCPLGWFGTKVAGLQPDPD